VGNILKSLQLVAPTLSEIVIQCLEFDESSLLLKDHTNLSAIKLFIPFVIVFFDSPVPLNFLVPIILIQLAIVN
jgi:hypothetical protein